ncbi:RraA family protein [Bordetella tumbae]|uniref:Putative 4-hydroxy-4-methyl-2-oxoglutarate aldolase n=1 Tax=Bordetella genomosp. 4 TaxID=463044 RepID=A0A261TMQ1_9BORD|nr:RraA family protein [Bordetella genomosp. 4]OZI43342.1 methyltransferase [Bordetella genomosp. 4]OZI50879.1 methyltransferase [Bordetella genomosp. 4]
MQNASPFTLNAAAPVLSAELANALQSIVTPHLSDNMHRQSGVVGLNRYNRSGKLVGSALTVKTRPGDNLFIYKAMTLIQPGHVLVVDAGGDLTNACVGEIMKRYLQQRGCVGLIVDGAIRDVAAFENDSFPCYARGHVHRGPYKDGPGEVNVPVTIGGQVIQPGDVIVADEDGIVSFPVAQADALVEKARAHAAKEERIMAEIDSGAERQSWLHAVLESKNLL